MKRFIQVLLVLTACQSTHKMGVQNNTIFDWQGHRGCRGLMPENTIPAMLKALDLGVKTLEMDAVFTKDSVIILSHEPFFNHEITTKPDGTYATEAEEKELNIYQMTYAEEKRYDVGLKPHPRFARQQKMAAIKPRLADVIDSAEAHARATNRPLPFYNIETKTKPETDNIYHPAPAPFVDMLMQLIKAKRIEDRTIIQSFDIRTLQYLHIHYPTIKTALLVEDYDKKAFAAQINDLGFTPTIYSPDQSLVNKLLVQQCQSAGVKLIPYTIEDTTTMKALIDMGVDGIITDYPDLIIKP